MSSLRGSRAVSNLQVETIRFSNAALPAGATGSVFALDEDGFMSLTSDIIASTLTVGGTVSITGTLAVGSLDVQELMDVSSAVIQNLRVTNSITLPPSVVIPTGSTSVEALYIFAGVTNTPLTGDYLKYALDVSGATILRGKLTTLDTISSRSIFVEGATAELVLRAGTTVDGRIRGTGSQLLVGSDTAIALGSQSGATVAMTVQPNARLVTITNGTTLNVGAIGGAGLQITAPLTVAAASNFTAAPTFSAASTFNAAATFNAPSTANATFTIASGATLDVRGSISNSAIGGNVTISDSLAVTGKILTYAPIEAQGQPLVLQATGGFGVTVAGNLQVTGGLNVAGSIQAPGISVSYINAPGGYLGVGTTTPAYTLDVSGMLQVRAPIDAVIPGISTSGSIQTSSVYGVVSVNPFGGINMTGNLSIRQLGSGIAGPTVQHLSPASDSYVNALGGRNFGVGTATPAYTLDVSGSARITGIVNNTYFNAVPTNPIPIVNPPNGRLESYQTYAYDYIGYRASFTGASPNGWEAQSGTSNPSNQGLVITMADSTGRPCLLSVYGTTIYAALTFDGATERIGVFKKTPTTTLDINGSLAASGNALVGGGLTATSAVITGGSTFGAISGGGTYTMTIGSTVASWDMVASQGSTTVPAAGQLVLVANEAQLYMGAYNNPAVAGSGSLIQSSGYNFGTGQYSPNDLIINPNGAPVGIGTTVIGAGVQLAVGGTVQTSYFRAGSENPTPLPVPPPGRLESSQMYATDYIGYAASFLDPGGWQASTDSPNNGQGMAMWQTGGKPCIIGVNGTTVSYPLVFDTVNQRVGVFNATPAYELDVVGNINTSATLRANGLNIIGNGEMVSLGVNTTANPAQYQLGVIGSAYVSSNIGIGTTNYSSYALNVNGSAIVSQGLTAASAVLTGASGSPYSLQISSTATTYAAIGQNPLPASQLLLSGPVSNRLYMGSYYTGGIATAAVIQASDFYDGVDHGENLLLNPIGGYVGIGTTTPSAALSVIGNATISGSITSPAYSITGGALKTAFIVQSSNFNQPGNTQIQYASSKPYSICFVSPYYAQGTNPISEYATYISDSVNGDKININIPGIYTINFKNCLTNTYTETNFWLQTMNSSVNSGYPDANANTQDVLAWCFSGNQNSSLSYTGYIDDDTTLMFGSNVPFDPGFASGQSAELQIIKLFA